MKGTDMNIKRDRMIGGILTVMGIIAVAMSMQIKVKTGSTDPGSRIFPMMASILLIVCGIGVSVTANGDESKIFLDITGWRKLALSFVVMIAYVFALKYIGFIISTPIFLYVITTLLSNGERLAVWHKLIYIAAVTVCFWFILHSLLKMNLPGGVLF